MIKKTIFILSLCLCASVVKCVFAGCPGNPRFNRASILHVTGLPLHPTYYHNLNTSQIESLWHSQFQGPRMREPGLTWMEHQMKTDFNFQGSQNGNRGPYCFWVESLNLDFSFTRMDVYLSNQYPEGSCEYNVILKHENQHVAINTRTFQKYRKQFLSALRRARNIPTRAKPLSVRSMEEGKALIDSRINQIVMPIYQRFKRELVAENAKIDTPQNYRRLQAQCKHWAYDYGR